LAPWAVSIFPALVIAIAGILAFMVAAKLLRPFDDDERESIEKAVGRKIWLV
jgi:hypothetical protein